MLTEKQKIDAALTAARTELAQTRHQREAMTIAERRGELIEKSFVSRQAQYIFITLRQAILNFPTRNARHVLELKDEHQAKAVLTKAAHEFLTELASFSTLDWCLTLRSHPALRASGFAFLSPIGVQMLAPLLR